MLTIHEVIKTFYNALLQRLKRYRGNWEQNDPTADDYIKNKPTIITDAIRYGAIQSLSNNQKKVARDNIDAASSSDVKGAVRYNASQSLDAEQKLRARTNIGAGTSSFSGSYNDLSDKPFQSCTVDNNGQFLRVVNGAATWDTVPNAEGVSF